MTTKLDGVRLAVIGWIATALTAMSFRPLLSDLSWVMPALLTLTIVIAAGIAVRLAFGHWAAVAAVELVVAACVMTMLFTAKTALLGVLPSAESLGFLGDKSAAAWKVMTDAALEARTGIEPAALTTTLELRVFVTVMVVVIGIMVDAIAASLERPLTASVPLLLLYCIPLTVHPTRTQALFFAAAALGFLLLLLADNATRLRAWGRSLGLSASRNPLGVSWLAPAAAVVGIALMALTPMPTPKNLLPKSDRGNITVVNPITNIREKLGTPKNRVALTYTTTAPSGVYIRIASDEEFTGELWKPRVGSISRDQAVQDQWPRPPGLAPDTPTETVETTIKLGVIHAGTEKETYLPAPYPPQRVDIAGEGWIYEDSSFNIVNDHMPMENIQYKVTHLLVPKSVESLRKAGKTPANIQSQFTALPPRLPSVIAGTARTAAGSGTAFDKAQRLEKFFSSSGKFTYDKTPSGAFGDFDSGQNAIVAFLRGRKGYCVQFASAMAVMARTQGIPARVAIGFRPGTQKDDGSYEVRIQDAHAWPELYFHGTGWVPFEPTPGVGGSAQTETEPSTPEQPQPEPSTQQAQPEPEPEPEPSVSETPPPDEPQNQPDQRPSLWDQLRPFLIGLLIVGLVALLAATPLLLARYRRKRRWENAQRTGQTAIAGWQELQERLADLRVTWPSSWTVRATTHRLTTDYQLGASAQDALSRLCDAVETACYTQSRAGGGPSEQVRRDVDTVVAATAATRNRKTQLLATALPRSGFAFIGKKTAMPVVDSPQAHGQTPPAE